MTEIARNATLRESRAAVGVTQRQVAEALGVSIPAVCRWEDGTASPTIEKLPALAALLGLRMDALIGVLIATKDAARREEAAG